MTSKICVIPARMGSSRFPNKPLTSILGFPMIGHVALRCKLEPIFDRVVVATCDDTIAEFCAMIDVETVMTSERHQRASDRVQEAVQILEKRESSRFGSVTMVQGDEPMVTPTMLRLALEGLEQSKAPVVNLKKRIQTPEEFYSPNCVKVVTDVKSNALYFSREPIPSSKLYKSFPKAYKQVCIIPFTRDFLDSYSALTPTYLEEVESVDMMRVLENGYTVHCVEIDEETYPVDVPADVSRVEHALATCRLVKQYLR